MEDKDTVKELLREINSGEKTFEDLNDDEKREIVVHTLKNKAMTYKPKKHFGVEYKKTRRKKNKATRKSRRNNR
jgi:hypothetical protein